MKKNEKGITLIALIITIIVLLILAGVSIAMLTGENGILLRAENAGEVSKIAEIEERVSLYLSEVTMNDYVEDNIHDIEGFLDSLVTEGAITQEERDTYDESSNTIEIYDTLIDLSGASNVVGSTGGASGSSTETWNTEKAVNSPEIEEGMIPIKWNGSNWEICSTTDEEWYNYIAQEGSTDGTSMWANMMLSDGTYKQGTTAIVGTEVDNIEDLGSMFVWIPRYSYSIVSEYHTNTVGEIEIQFLKGNTNESEIGTTSWDNEAGEGNWNVHPAFTFGDDELTGLWVAKFGASYNGGKIAVKPNVEYWRGISLDNIFENCLNMNEEDNGYEISKDDSEVDTHLMLNSEWGSIVYLLHSNVGRNKTEVTKNDDSGYITGGTNGYITNTNQSSTGNVTGIYDLSGGISEYVAAYYTESTSTSNGANLVAKKDTKYVEIYENTYLETIYGDAVYETSSKYWGNDSWTSDYSYFPTSTHPFFVRGGNNFDGDEVAGVFAFNGNSGIASSGLRLPSSSCNFVNGIINEQKYLTVWV